MNNILIFGFAILISGCAETIDTLYALNRTDIEAYDNGVCENGEPFLPDQPRR